MFRRAVIAVLLVSAALAGPGVVRALTTNDDAGSATVVRSGSGRLPAIDLVDIWADRSREHPNDFLSRTELAVAYVTLARETGDVTAYAKARLAAEEALAIKPDHGPAQLTLASVDIADHRFADALAWAESQLATAPTASPLLAVKGDALLELGRYTEAEATYDELLAAERSAPILSRLARLAFVRGRPDDAVEFATQAAAAAADLPLTLEARAWYDMQLADILLHRGDVEGALSSSSLAVQRAPSLPAALAIHGRALAMSGDLDAAAASYEAAIGILPEPVWLLALVDVHTARGDTPARQLTLDTLAAVAQLRPTTVHDRSIALYEARFGDADHAVRLARSEVDTRGDVYSYDALAWSLFAAGHEDEAAQAADRALGQNTLDAVLLARAGEIFAAVGRTVDAVNALDTALTIHPNFDPVAAPRAAALLEELS